MLMRICNTIYVKTVENLIEEIKENRAKLNQATSFDEITICWQNLKNAYEKCSTIVNDVAADLAKLDSIETQISVEDQEKLDAMPFSAALARMEEISAQIKTATISDMPKLMQEMQLMKTFCFKKLDQEKIKMEEIK